eukprot:1828626-Pyramimonas_sp.AAC.1
MQMHMQMDGSSVRVHFSGPAHSTVAQWHSVHSSGPAHSTVLSWSLQEATRTERGAAALEGAPFSVGTNVLMHKRYTSHKPSYNFHNSYSRDWREAGGRRLLGKTTAQSRDIAQRFRDVSEMQV